MKKILYYDLDGVLADFEGEIYKTHPNLDLTDYVNNKKIVEDICIENTTFFEKLEPIEGAIKSVITLNEYYEIYFLSSPMWSAPHSYTGKRIWLEKTFKEIDITDKLILTSRKDLCIGNYLIDDRLNNGAAGFHGDFIHFGTEKYPNHEIILNYLLEKKEKFKL